MKKITLPKISVLCDTPNEPYSAKVGWSSDKNEYWTDGIGGPTEGYFITKRQANEYKSLLKQKRRHNKYVGSSFDSFMKAQGLEDEVYSKVKKRKVKKQ